ncbi:MAG: agmatinase [Anaerolineales bacterium]|nr:agmatinase [Anaerolineales bacterium]
MDYSSNFNMKEKELVAKEIVVLGVPVDRNSSFLRGSKLAPQRIREALFCESTNMWTENMIDLGEMSGWQFLDDLELPASGEFAHIENKIEGLLAKKARVISLGGDHSITYPIIQAYGKKFSNLSILQLDAHPDLYDELDGNRNSHACPFARIMEEGLVEQLVQVGIRTSTGHTREQALRFGVEMIHMREIERASEIVFNGPVYISLDMDCLDPAFAPGVSHYEPGGMSTREVLNIIQSLDGTLVGADIVEYNPERDVHGVTAMVAGKLLKEIIARMLAENLDRT